MRMTKMSLQPRFVFNGVAKRNVNDIGPACMIKYPQIEPSLFQVWNWANLNTNMMMKNRKALNKINDFLPIF